MHGLGYVRLSWTHKLQNIGFYQNVPFSAYDRTAALFFSNDSAQLWTYNPNTNAMTSVDTFAGGIQNLGYPNLVVDPADKLSFSSVTVISSSGIWLARRPTRARTFQDSHPVGAALFQGGGGHGLGAAMEPVQKVIVDGAAETV